jgi:hypothetical protein
MVRSTRKTASAAAFADLHALRFNVTVFYMISRSASVQNCSLQQKTRELLFWIQRAGLLTDTFALDESVGRSGS